MSIDIPPSLTFGLECFFLLSGKSVILYFVANWLIFGIKNLLNINDIMKSKTAIAVAAK